MTAPQTDPRCLAVVPCLNEARHIGLTLDRLRADAEALDMALVVVDGGSTDDTREIVGDIAARDRRVALLDTPKRIQSAAIDLAVETFAEDRVRTFEGVPLERTGFGWLARRHFRSGRTHGRLTGVRRPGAATQAAAIGAAAAKAGYCFALAVITLPWATWRNANLLRGLMHAGAVGGLLGVREITQYGQLEETIG